MKASLKHHVLAGEYTSVLDLKGTDPDSMFIDVEEGRPVEAQIIGDAKPQDPMKIKSKDEEEKEHKADRLGKAVPILFRFAEAKIGEDYQINIKIIPDPTFNMTMRE